MSRIRWSYWTVLVLALWSCRKDVELFEPYAPSAQELANLLAVQVPAASTHTIFTLNSLSTDKMLETPGGARIFLVDTDNLFANKNSGALVHCSTCPDLKVEVTEVLDKSDIIAHGLNTVGDTGVLFESGGMVRVTATCNGQQLELLPDRELKIQIPNNNTQSGYFVFAQDASQWSNSNQEVFEAEWPVLNGTTKKGYELLVKKMGWSASGRSLADSGSQFCIELPSGFADQNTLAYLVFKDQQVVAPLQFILSQNKFCYPKAPAGYQVKLVAVSKLGERFWLGKAETEVGTNATFPMGTNESTLEAMLNYVKSL
jgi:hypothetical protein